MSGITKEWLEKESERIQKNNSMSALERLLAYAKELELSEYHTALARWERELSELKARKPQEPEQMIDESKVQPGSPVCEVLDMKYNCVRFYRRTGDAQSAYKYLQTGTKLVLHDDYIALEELRASHIECLSKVNEILQAENQELKSQISELVSSLNAIDVIARVDGSHPAISVIVEQALNKGPLSPQ
jgi:SOS-response transcriptional repressor LexA